MPSQDPQQDAPSGCLFRLFWMILGNMALLAVAGQLLTCPRGWFSGLDVAYWSVVALLIAARYADIRYCKGTTGEGKPCTLEDWRRYAVIVVLSTGVVWLALHFLSAFWLSA
jgi:hypothetical protein